MSLKTELMTLDTLPDDALWIIVKEKMLPVLQARIQVLMHVNSTGKISDSERSELKSLVDEGTRIMLRKARASVVLSKRGHRVMMKDLS
jgi:hypothetical protein